MTHPNLEVIRHFFEAYAQYDLTAIQVLLDQEVRWDVPSHHPMSGSMQGLAEVTTFLGHLRKSNFKIEPLLLGVNGDYIVDCHRGSGSRKNTYKIDMLSCLLWKIENGKIKEVTNFVPDQHEANHFSLHPYSLESVLN